MMKKILFLSLLFCLAVCSTAMADLIDPFNAAHDYLTSGVAGTGWSGIMNVGNATILNASITAADKLRITGVGNWGGTDASGPFLYKEVTGDFIAETKAGAEHFACAGLMVRLADVAAGGAGEDNMILAYWPVEFWNVGTIFWPTDNGARPEFDNSGYNGGVIPSYLRVERRGANFYWSRSSDGVTWQALPSANPRVRPDMNVATLQVGLIQNFGGWAEQDVDYEYFKLIEQVTAFSGTKKVTEGGAAVTITVDLLGPAPTAPVDVVLTEVTAGDPNDLLINGLQSPVTLTFPAGVNQKTLTLQAMDDLLQEGPENVRITATVLSTDSNYAGHPGGSIVVNVIDNEAGLLVDDGDGVIVDENGTLSDSISMVLSTEPTADVTVTISTDGQTNVTSPLVFTSANWNTPQIAIVKGVDDAILETDPHTGTLSFSASSSDPAYQGVTAFDVVVTIKENDCGAWGYSRYDANRDCVVNLGDMAQLALQWMQCTFPNADGCVDLR